MFYYYNTIQSIDLGGALFGTDRWVDYKLVEGETLADALRGL